MMATGVLSEVPQWSIKIVFSSAERQRSPAAAQNLCSGRLVQRMLACPSSWRLSPLAHVRTKDGVNPRLILRALSLEPSQDVGVDAERNRLFCCRFHNGGLVPEIVRKVC